VVEGKPGKKLDPCELVEERLEGFSERIYKIEERVSEIDSKARKSFDKYSRYLQLISSTMYWDMLILGEITRLRMIPLGDIKEFDDAIGYILDKQRDWDQIHELGMDLSTLTVKSITGMLIEIAHIWNLRFEEVASYFICKFGKATARKLVGNEDLMECYGKEVIPIWEKLLEE